MIWSNHRKYDSKRWLNFFFFLNYVFFDVEINIFMKNDIMIVIYVKNLIFTKFNFAAIFWLKNALNKRFENERFKFVYLLFRHDDFQKLKS
jgi:hypothetical protein